MYSKGFFFNMKKKLSFGTHYGYVVFLFRGVSNEDYSTCLNKKLFFCNSSVRRPTQETTKDEALYASCTIVILVILMNHSTGIKCFK